jgi:S-DNA-T family DNA segregation ATPase FtsK/SpoIIIE
MQFIKIEMFKIKATVGPSVQPCMKLYLKWNSNAKIKSLEDDIVLSLSALGIRIIAPIPEKELLVLRVPKQNPNDGFYEKCDWLSQI